MDQQTHTGQVLHEVTRPSGYGLGSLQPRFTEQPDQEPHPGINMVQSPVNSRLRDGLLLLPSSLDCGNALHGIVRYYLFLMQTTIEGSKGVDVGSD